MQAVIAIENSQLVDDLRRSRAQVRRVDRLGTLGTLAAGLAHEINNPLVSLNTFLSLAPEKRETPTTRASGATITSSPAANSSVFAAWSRR